MANGIRTGDPCGFNKGHSSKFREGPRVRQTLEEGRRTYRPKRCGNNNKDEDNSPKNFWFVSQNPREFYAPHFLGQILFCIYTIWRYGQISISCTVPSKVVMVLIIFETLEIVPKNFEKKTGRTGDQRMKLDHPKHFTAQIS